MAIGEVAVSTQRGFFLRTVPGSQQAYILSRAVGGSGAAGDRVQRLILNITNPNAAGVTLVDSANEFPIVTPGPNVALGPMIVELGVYSQFGPWALRTGGGVTATVVGEFSP